MKCTRSSPSCPNCARAAFLEAPTPSRTRSCRGGGDGGGGGWRRRRRRRRRTAAAETAAAATAAAATAAAERSSKQVTLQSPPQAADPDSLAACPPAPSPSAQGSSKQACAQVVPRFRRASLPSANSWAPGGPHVWTRHVCAQVAADRLRRHGRRTSRPVAACRTFGPRALRAGAAAGSLDVIWRRTLRRPGSPHFLVQHAPTSAGVADRRSTLDVGGGAV